MTAGAPVPQRQPRQHASAHGPAWAHAALCVPPSIAQELSKAFSKNAASMSEADKIRLKTEHRLRSEEMSPIDRMDQLKGRLEKIFSNGADSVCPPPPRARARRGCARAHPLTSSVCVRACSGQRARTVGRERPKGQVAAAKDLRL